MNVHSLPSYLWIFILLGIWELYWKIKAAWKAARENQLYWFIAILIINSVGILPLLYIYVFSKKKA